MYVCMTPSNGISLSQTDFKRAYIILVQMLILVGFLDLSAAALVSFVTPLSADVLVVTALVLVVFASVVAVAVVCGC